MSIVRGFVILTICFLLFLPSSSFTWWVCQSDSGSQNLGLNWGNFRVRYFAWTNVGCEHLFPGWYSAWAEVDGDRFRESGSHDGSVNAYSNKRKDRWIWQAPLSVFDDAKLNPS